MTATLTETALFWRGYWPPPYCRQRGEHAFDTYEHDYVYGYCGGRVAHEDAQLLEVWWQNFHRWSLVYERN